jgi:dTDP-4-amino-4,6-dideoxygalactose transaminase
MHLQPAYFAHGDGPGSLPCSEALSEQVLSLPLNAYASREEVDYVCVTAQAFAKGK